MEKKQKLKLVRSIVQLLSGDINHIFTSNQERETNNKRTEFIQRKVIWNYIECPLKTLKTKLGLEIAVEQFTKGIQNEYGLIHPITRLRNRIKKCHTSSNRKGSGESNDDRLEQQKAYKCLTE